MRVMSILSVAVAPLLLAIQASNVQAADLLVNGKTCGSYSTAVIGTNGLLQLTDAVLSGHCQFGETTPPGGETTPPGGETNPPGGETNPPGGETNPPVNPGVPAVCGADVPVINHKTSWSNGIIGRSLTASMRGIEDYVIKIEPGAMIKGGYGTIDSVEVSGNSATRTMSISECPGDYTANLPDAGRCAITGFSPSLRWSHDSAAPKGSSYCRLSPNKTYYLNIRHATLDNLNESTCKDAKGKDMLCSTYPSYSPLRNNDI